MKPIRGEVEVTLSTDEIVAINELIQRDKPKPLVEHEFNDGTTSTKCPCCGRFISTVGGDWNYCPDCGQHIDTENIAF